MESNSVIKPLVGFWRISKCTLSPSISENDIILDADVFSFNSIISCSIETTGMSFIEFTVIITSASSDKLLSSETVYLSVSCP